MVRKLKGEDNVFNIDNGYLEPHIDKNRYYFDGKFLDRDLLIKNPRFNKII